MKKCLLLVLCALVFVQGTFAQIRVSSVNVDEWVRKNFGGQGVVIGNIKHHGFTLSMATFTSPPTLLKVQKGLILSTGNAFNVAGFNNRYNLSNAFKTLDQDEKDPDLASLIKGKFYDISYVEFDFVPLANNLQFNYQFGSEEYPEYVGSQYNDIFAFFISDGTTTKNIALIPGKEVPVSINTVNHKTDSVYYIDNNPFTNTKPTRPGEKKEEVKRSLPAKIIQSVKDAFTSPRVAEADAGFIQDPLLIKKLNQGLYRNLQFDGITSKLVAQAYVEPYKKYHLKIIISDVADNIYDSGVFIEDKSLTAKRDSLAPGFVDYPNLDKLIDPKLILAGKKMEDILPDTFHVNNVAVYFGLNKSDIIPSEMGKLKNMAAVYNSIRSSYDMYLVGHTDSIGSLTYNIDLSKRRNQSVTDSLRRYIPDIQTKSITEKAYLQPAATNSTEDGRQRNRRVEIIFIKKRE